MAGELFKIAVDNKELIRRFSALESNFGNKVLIKAMNDTAFDIRDAFKAEFRRIFDKPRPLTINSILFKPAKAGRLVAEIFVRDDVSDGTPPSKYLFPQVVGGNRAQKSFEKRLQALPRVRNSLFAPGRDMPQDAYGNLPAKLYPQILSQLGAQFDPTSNDTEQTKRRRLKRTRKKGGGGNFFILPNKRGKLKANVIYERVNFIYGLGSKIRIALQPIDRTSYKPRFKPGPLAQRIFDEKFAESFHRRLISMGG